MSVPLRRPSDVRPSLMLACEGRDDRAFLESLLSHLGIDARIDEYRGASQLPRYLRGLRDSSEFQDVRSLGVLRDGDDYPDRTWQSVVDAPRRLDLPAPHVHGTVHAAIRGIDGRTRSIGIFIMPDGHSPGALEDLCLQAIAQDPAMACIQDFLTCVQVRSGVACPEQHVPKAMLNAWLASRSNPTLRLGQAIASRDIQPDSPVFGPVRQFLQDLASAASQPSPDATDA